MGLFDFLSGNDKAAKHVAPKMFCYQCEMSMPEGCGAHGESKGTCGKTATKARLQDLMTFGLRGLSAYREHARELIDMNPTADDLKTLIEIDDV